MICMFKAIQYVVADVFENFWNMCHEMYGFDPAKFISGSG